MDTRAATWSVVRSISNAADVKNAAPANIAIGYKWPNLLHHVTRVTGVWHVRYGHAWAVLETACLGMHW